MKIYLDACCLSRLTDDQTQPRVRWEAEAVERVFQSIQHRLAIWVSSEALLDEILQNPIPKRRAEAQALFKFSSEIYQIDAATSDRARQLEAAGYGSYDALHLAAAESAKVDFLLSTDDRFVRKAFRGLGSPLVAVRNPVSWVKEHLIDRF
ncbi:MAG: type II toxin-antitoxin system VapC family toxin [Terriglobia bacterium]